ncbi:MAG: hypothetical protein ABIP75_18975 [Pyrinomonadaceae bacterium]
MTLTKCMFLSAALGCGLVFSSCSTLASKTTTGVVIARRAQIRSSVAVVAADLLEVARGDVLDILESSEVQDQTVADTKEKWFRVRAHDDAGTEGWIEARNLLTEEMLAQSRKLADEDKAIPTQATGQLRNTSNLRLSPDYTTNDNVLMKMENGATFDIVDWKRLPKTKIGDAQETGEDPKPGGTRPNTRPTPPTSGGSDEEPKGPEETTELWYKVRLQPNVSPAPSGWIYGKQVELLVPADIIFYRTGRDFVGWQRLDGDPEAHASSQPKDKDAAKEEKPGSWVILEKASSSQPHTLDEPYFDRIYVVGYEKYDQEHYTAYRSPDLNGYLPMKIEGKGEDKTFTLTVSGDDGQKREAVFRVYKDDRGHLKVTPPADLPKVTPKK